MAQHKLGFVETVYEEAYWHWHERGCCMCPDIVSCKHCLCVFNVLTSSIGEFIAVPFDARHRFTADSDLVPINSAQMCKEAPSKIIKEHETTGGSVVTPQELATRIKQDFPGIDYEHGCAPYIPSIKLETCKYAPMIVHGDEMYRDLKLLYRQCLAPPPASLSVDRNYTVFAKDVVDTFMLLQFHTSGLLELSCSTVDELWWSTIRLDKQWLRLARKLRSTTL